MSARHLRLLLLLIALGAAMTACRSRKPTDPLRAGIAALKKDRFAAALTCLEDAARTRQTDPAVWAHLGIACWKLGKLDEAADAFKRAAALAPTDPQPLELLGQVFIAEKRWVEANEALTGAYKRAPRSPRVVTALAVVQLNLSNADTARGYLNHALTLDPAYPPALYNLAIVNRDWARNDVEAEACFRKFLEVAPRSPERAAAKAALREILADRAKQRRSTPGGWFRRGAPAAVAEQRTEPLSPTEIASVTQTVALARAAIRNENFDEALMRLKEARKAYPRNPDVCWELAVLYDQHLEDSDHSLKAYRDFVSDFPDDRRASRARDRMRHLKEKSEGSADPESVPLPKPSALQFRRPSKPDVGLAVDAYRQGGAYLKKADWTRAIYSYTLAVENDPTFLNAYFNLGLAYRGARDLARARDAFIYALQIKPDMAEAHYMLGLIFRDLRDDPAATRHLHAAVRLNPGYADAHLLLGLIYQGDPSHESLARTHFSRYLEISPTGPGAPQAKLWLSSHRAAVR